MARERYVQVDEPDVTPLINVNLLVLVMTMLIASHSAKLLPLALPKTTGTAGGDNLSMEVGPETYAMKVGAGEHALASPEALVSLIQEPEQYARGWQAAPGPADLPAWLAAIRDGSVVSVSMTEGASYGAVGYALHALKRQPTVQAFVDMSCALTLKVEKDGYALGDQAGLTKEQLAESLKDLEPMSVVLISMDPKAKYESLVWVVDCIMAMPNLKVAFGQPAPAAPSGGPTTAPAPTDG